MKFSKLVLSGVLGIALLSATSCGTPKNVAYFQDLNNNPDTVITLQNRVITVKPTDKLYIGVKSKDPQISQLFNLTGGTSSGAYNMSQDAYYYTIDSKGDIDFPVVGKIQVAGLTREEIAEKVKKSLVDASLVKDPTVTVSLSNLHYSMMGEVAKPGQYAIEEEKVTILDAISKAGDLTIQGKRNDVMVLRQETDTRRSTRSTSAPAGTSSVLLPTISSRTMWYMLHLTIPRREALRSTEILCNLRDSG